MVVSGVSTLNARKRPCVRGLVVAVLLAALSACDTAGEAGSAEQEQHTESENDQGTVPPRIENDGKVDGMPRFHEIPAGAERKEAFFRYLRPIVRDINREVEKRRLILLALEEQLENGQSPGAQALEWLERMAKRYRVDTDDPAKQVEALKPRIDTVPESLALAQGALESAWGTSRFAREGNNIFGKWCFTEGCGIVPAQRRADATHEVARYDNVADAVRDYIHHLNSHPVYESLRALRAKARQEDRSPSGVDLAAGLEKYSAKGEGYIRLVRRLIERNELAGREDDQKDA